MSSFKSNILANRRRGHVERRRHYLSSEICTLVPHPLNRGMNYHFNGNTLFKSQLPRHVLGSEDDEGSSWLSRVWWCKLWVKMRWETLRDWILQQKFLSFNLQREVFLEFRCKLSCVTQIRRWSTLEDESYVFFGGRKPLTLTRLKWSFNVFPVRGNFGRRQISWRNLWAMSIKEPEDGQTGSMERWELYLVWKRDFHDVVEANGSKVRDCRHKSSRKRITYMEPEWTRRVLS